MAVMPESTSARVHDSLAARCRYVNSTCPRLIRGYSSATGSLTLQTRSASAHTSSAAPRIWAPAATKSSSGMDEPAPASFSTTTVWPRTVSSCTPDGVMATRYSLSLTSRGTPTRTAHLFRLGRAFAPPRSLGAAGYFSPPSGHDDRYGGALKKCPTSHNRGEPPCSHSLAFIPRGR